MFLIRGKLAPGISFEQGEQAIAEELARLQDEPVTDIELQKVVNRFESNDLFSNMNYLNRASNLAYYELIGQAEDINTENEKYRKIKPENLKDTARVLFCENNSTTLRYHAKKKEMQMSFDPPPLD